jgi:hypothetical protein
MNSWAITLRLLAVMAAIAIFYLIGRWVSATLQGAAGGALPTPWGG